MSDFEDKIKNSFRVGMDQNPTNEAWNSYLKYEKKKDKKSRKALFIILGLLVLLCVTLIPLKNKETEKSIDHFHNEIKQQRNKNKNESEKEKILPIAELNNKEPKNSEKIYEVESIISTQNAQRDKSFRQPENTISRQANYEGADTNNGLIDVDLSYLLPDEDKMDSTPTTDKVKRSNVPSLPYLSMETIYLPLQGNYSLTLPKNNPINENSINKEFIRSWEVGFGLGTGTFNHRAIKKYLSIIALSQVSYSLNENWQITGNVGFQKIDYTAFVQNAQIGIRSVALPSPESFIEKINNQLYFVEIGLGISYEYKLNDKLSFIANPQISTIKEFNRSTSYTFSLDERSTTFIRNDFEDNNWYKYNIKPQVGVKYKIMPHTRLAFNISRLFTSNNNDVFLPDQTRFMIALHRQF